MTNFCPHCGFNLTADQAIIDGPWELHPHFALLDGKPAFCLTDMQIAILHTLASAQGRPVSHDTLALRIGSEGRRVVPVLIYRMRKTLGARCPVATRKGSGYLWACVP